MLLLWSPIAWAGLSEEDAAQEVQRIQTTLGERVLVGALGPDAERVFVRQARMNSGLDIELVRIPTAGDLAREQQAALQRTGLRCGVLVQGGDDGWAVEPFGDCSPPGPLVVSEAPVTTPGEDAPPTEAIIAQLDARQADFERRSLSIAESHTGTWDVLEGAKNSLSAPAFAALVNDTPTEQSLAREKRLAATTAKSFRIGGAVVATAALVPLIGMPSAATPAGEDRLWTSLFLAGTGLMAVVVAPRAIEGISAAQMEIDSYYTRDEIDAHIETYNTGLKMELGLLEPEPEDADEDVLEGLLEPEELEAVEETSEKEASTGEDTPSDAESLEPAPAEAPATEEAPAPEAGERP